MYLDARNGALMSSQVKDEGVAEYESASGSTSFDYSFEHDTEVVGPMKLRIWLEIENGSDADVYAYVQKTDPSGQPLLAQILPGVLHVGAGGSLRASRRELDETRSTPLAPVAAHRRDLPVTPGTAVPLDVAIWPYGMKWHAGQRLRVIIGGTDLALRNPASATVNSGVHRVRTGGAYDSYLLVPAIAAPAR